MSTAPHAEVSLFYAFSCINRGLTYGHYCMNYGRRPEFTDTIKLTYEQYIILESKCYEKH